MADQSFKPKPAVRIPVRHTTTEAQRRQRAEALLSGAPGSTEYAAARDAVRELGLDPDQIPHRRPGEAPAS